MIASLASVKSATAVLLFAGLTKLTSAAAAAGNETGGVTSYKVDTRDDILKSAKTLAADLIALYDGNQPGKIPGILPGPPPLGDYYWWQGGAFLSTYLDYFRLTGDDTYNDIVAEGLVHQSGPYHDFLPTNWTATMGNDDQCTWATAALQAAEVGLPSVDGQPAWSELAETAFATMAHPDRHDETCGGGLRWQIPPTNTGYNYKNSMNPTYLPT